MLVSLIIDKAAQENRGNGFSVVFLTIVNCPGSIASDHAIAKAAEDRASPVDVVDVSGVFGELHRLDRT